MLFTPEPDRVRQSLPPLNPAPAWSQPKLKRSGLRQFLKFHAPAQELPARFNLENTMVSESGGNMKGREHKSTKGRVVRYLFVPVKIQTRLPRRKTQGPPELHSNSAWTGWKRMETQKSRGQGRSNPIRSGRLRGVPREPDPGAVYASAKRQSHGFQSGWGRCELGTMAVVQYNRSFLVARPDFER